MSAEAKRLADNLYESGVSWAHESLAWGYCTENKGLYKALLQVAKQLEEANRDAQRYRWLKRYCGFGIRRNGVHELTVSFSMVQPDSIHQLDAAIDAAMKEQE